MKNDELTKLVIDAASNLDITHNKLTEITCNLKSHCRAIEEAEVLVEVIFNKLHESSIIQK